jgi:type II secretory pathway pseudopilin PulG
MKYNNFTKGLILVNVLVFGVIAIIVTTALVNWGGAMLRDTRQLSSKEQALQIAEAGIEYYRWHLAHASTDYKDGNATTSNGPFIHDYSDKDGNKIGQFALTITPPPTGSTLVIIKSKGTVLDAPNVSRTIQVSMAIPSFAKFALVANDNMRMGEGTEVYGPVHSNDGIRFDGIAHNLVTSAKDKYNDTDNPGGMVFGVYTTVSPEDPNPPASVPNRPDVFMAGRQFPVATVDFAGITADLSTMKTQAQASGKYFAPSGSQGYHIVFKTNNTFDIYKVTSIYSADSQCKNGQNQDKWGTWSIQKEVNPTTGAINVPTNYPIPSNGLIFVEDNVWVDGKIDGSRVSIGAARFPQSPGQSKDIIINKDLLYTHYDGTDSIGLIAQGNVSTGLSSEDDLRIDAALISQNGRVGRNYYSNKCGAEYTRDTLTLYGMIGTRERYGFAYTDGTGYQTRNIIYDSNLLYSPPPSFPLTSNQYSILSWEEVK